MIYIVNVSGGLTSYEALRRTLEKYGRENTRAVFADTRVEDADLYRFLDDQERAFGITITRLADGRTPFQVWHDRRAITLPNSAAPCSQVLKRDVINAWVAEHFSNTPYTIVLGMDWSELDRMQRAEARYAPVPVWFPLAEKPYMDKCHIADALEKTGIKPPRLYDLGFAHNNCGGGCVKAGQAHWALLWRTKPDVYAHWEAEEVRFIEFIGKKRTILKEQRAGVTSPLSLTEFRERLERGEGYDRDEWGGCGCFAPIVQGRFDDLLMEVSPHE